MTGRTRVPQASTPIDDLSCKPLQSHVRADVLRWIDVSCFPDDRATNQARRALGWLRWP
jgi:hypothetical protein